MNFLEVLKFTVSVIRSIGVQLSDNILDIWSSIVLFRGEIVIIQVFDEDISSLAIAKTVKIYALAKCCWQNFHDISPLKKTVNGHFLFRLQYNCPVLPSNIQDRRHSGQRFFNILILFCGDDLFSPSKLSHGRLPKYLIDRRTFRTNRSDPYAGVRTDSKKPPVRAGGFSSCSRPNLLAVSLPSAPLLLSAPNQNRHATQAILNAKVQNCYCVLNTLNLSSLKCVYKTFTEVEKKNYSDKKKYMYLLKRNGNEPVTRFLGIIY